MWIKTRSLEWSSAIRGLGLGFMLGGYSVHRLDWKMISCLFVGVILINLGHFLPDSYSRSSDVSTS